MSLSLSFREPELSLQKRHPSTDGRIRRRRDLRHVRDRRGLPGRAVDQPRRGGVA